jgi:hypothetical protein
MSIFGRARTLVVNCQGLRTALPSVRSFDRQQHAAILWDEIDPLQVLSNKVVFQSGPMRLAFSQSACNAYSYTMWLWSVPHVLCSNEFPMQAGDRLSDGSVLSAEGADWLQQNLVRIECPSGGTWFLHQAAEPEPVLQFDDLPDPAVIGGHSSAADSLDGSPRFPNGMGSPIPSATGSVDLFQALP